MFWWSSCQTSGWNLVTTITPWLERGGGCSTPHAVEYAGCSLACYYAATNAANTVLPSCRQTPTKHLLSFNTTQTVCELLGLRLATIQQHELRFCYGFESFSHTFKSCSTVETVWQDSGDELVSVSQAV
jgi:hypothetical protein